MNVPFDLKAITAPIPGENPAGIDLRETQDGDFANLREIVEEAQQRRAMIERNEESAPPDWVGVAAGCADVLTRKSKDIQVLAWFVESATRAYGLEGIAIGLEAAASLVDAQLPQMYPEAEPGDEFRLRPFNGLDHGGAEIKTNNGALVRLIQRQPIIKRAAGQERGPFSTLDTKLGASGPPEDEIKRAAALMSAADVATTSALLERALKAAQSLQAAFSRHCKLEAPPTSGIIECLQECQSMLRRYTKDNPVVDDAAGGTSGGMEDGKSNGVSAACASTRAGYEIGTVPMEREAVLAAMTRLVTVLDKLEPQSLAVPAMQQAIAWARMDRATLMIDLLGSASGDSAKDKLFRLIGLKSPEKSEEK
jgi:type VI secretion system ImpA family protein